MCDTYSVTSVTDVAAVVWGGPVRVVSWVTVVLLSLVVWESVSVTFFAVEEFLFVWVFLLVEIFLVVWVFLAVEFLVVWEIVAQFGFVLVTNLVVVRVGSCHREKCQKDQSDLQRFQTIIIMLLKVILQLQKTWLVLTILSAFDFCLIQLKLQFSKLCRFNRNLPYLYAKIHPGVLIARIIVEH